MSVLFLSLSTSAGAVVAPKKVAAERNIYRAGGTVRHANGAKSLGSGLSKSGPRGETGAAVIGPAGGRGVVRVTLRSKRVSGIDLTVVFGRAEAATRGVLSGYGVRLRGGKLQVVRVKDGAVRGTIASARAKIRRKGTVTLVAQSVGGYLDVQAYAGSRNLGGLTTKLAISRGHLGVLFGKKHPASVVIQRITTRGNCAGLASALAGKQGATRWVSIATEKLPLAKAAAPARVRVMETLKATRKRPSSLTVLKTDLVGIEAMVCAKVAVAVSTETPWKYVDASYRRYRRSRPAKTATGFVVDRSYKNPRMVARLLKAYHRRFPSQTALVKIGLSRQGRTIYALAVTRDIAATTGKPSVLLNAAHHGNEPLSTEFVFDALQILLEQGQRADVSRWLDHLVVWIVPQVNPDGAHAFLETSKRTGRKNGLDYGRDGKRDILDGVDLNRN